MRKNFRQLIPLFGGLALLFGSFAIPYAMVSRHEPAILGFRFRYEATSGPSEILVLPITQAQALPVQDDSGSVAIWAEVPFVEGSTSAIYARASRELMPEIKVVVPGYEVATVKSGPLVWQWMFTPTKSGVLRIAIQVGGPNQTTAWAYTMGAEVENSFGLTARQQAILQGGQAIVAVLVMLGLWSWLTKASK